MKPICIKGEKETRQEFLSRREKVDAIIRANLDKTDFAIGLLCDPPLSDGVIRSRRHELRLLRKKTKLSKRLPEKLTA